MKESWQNLSDLITNPSATFARLKFNPKWLIAFLVFCILSLVIGWTLAPFTQRLLTLRAIKNGVPDEIPSFASVMMMALLWAVLWCVVLSVILTVVARIFKLDRAVKFKHLFAAVMHTSMIRSLIFLVNVGMIPIFWRVEEITSVIDTRMLPGLHMLVGSIENTNLSMFLSYINVLSIWHILVLTIAVSIIAGVNKTQASFVAVCIWLLRSGIEVVFTAMFLS